MDSGMNRDASADAGVTPVQHGHHNDGGTMMAPMEMADAGLPPADAKSDAPIVYTCPMHPEVTSAQPGRCPKCGMTLVPKAKTAAPDPPPETHVHGGAPARGMIPGKGSQ